MHPQAGWRLEATNVIFRLAEEQRRTLRDSGVSAAAAGVVLAYRRVSTVDRAFRSMKSVDPHVRPIRHWSADRVLPQSLRFGEQRLGPTA